MGCRPIAHDIDHTE